MAQSPRPAADQVPGAGAGVEAGVGGAEVRALLDALLAVPGVTGAALTGDELTGDAGATAGAVRLELAPDADDRAVAVAVDAVLREGFGLALDARTGGHEGRREPRLAMRRVRLSALDLGVEVEVTLSGGSRVSTGRAEAAATPEGVNRAVAVATAEAVRAALPAPVRIDVEQVAVAATGASRTAVVVMTLLTHDGAERLAGASVVREDVRHAVIRATLAALNRRAGDVLAGGPPTPDRESERPWQG